MIPVLVGGGDHGQQRGDIGVVGCILKQGIDGREVICGVNEDLRASGFGGNQVHIVCHGRDHGPAYRVGGKIMEQ